MFRDITLEWSGEKVTIPASRVMGAIAVVEQHLTLPEMAMMHQRYASEGIPPAYTKLSPAYAALLTYAGLPTTPEQVYRGIFQGESATVIDALSMLLILCTPADILEASDPKPQARPQKNAGRAKRSKASTKR
jgi:hypothetical protein